MLAGGFDDSPINSQGGAIAWFCFVAVCIITPLVCGIVFWSLRCRARRQETTGEQRRAEQEANVDIISRIEANVKVFSDIEGQRRKQSIRRTHRRNIRVRFRL